MNSKIKLSVFKKALNQDIKIIRVLFGLLSVLIISFMFSLTINKYTKTANVISLSFSKKDSIIKRAIYNADFKIKEVSQLKEQFGIIEEIKKSYLFIAHRYSSYNYSFSIFFTVFSIVTGILGFIIVKIGWDNTNNYYLKSAFLISFFCSTLFGLLPNVFGTKENIKNNLTKYNFYSGLQLDIYNLVSDNSGYIKRSTKQSIDSLNTEITLITKKIKENQDLYFDIHIDKVPTDFKPLE
ncbi:hypothetical protein ACQY1Q_15275 [Tenacibaculum sp. TC6]|uniref:hypothetical protein n=1 Tax=Tenacibaculum sp. TC6 TaxID=3423223 RepID=UPI003D36B1A0